MYGGFTKRLKISRGFADRVAVRSVRSRRIYPRNWNGANDFIFFGKRGSFASNQKEDNEVSMLAPHLLQNSMVYVNTLMVQKVLQQPRWERKLTPVDFRALSPLIWDHVNPYGRFDLDMGQQLALA